MLSKSETPQIVTTSGPLIVRAAAQLRQSIRTDARKRTRSAVVRMCLADMSLPHNAWGTEQERGDIEAAHEFCS